MIVINMKQPTIPYNKASHQPNKIVYITLPNDTVDAENKCKVN